MDEGGIDRQSEALSDGKVCPLYCFLSKAVGSFSLAPIHLFVIVRYLI